ncbi:hypothetical protein [Streptomyces sp. SGAir0957]
MPHHSITWTIDVEDADNHINAARRALAVHRHHKPTSWATGVTVTDDREEHLPVGLDPAHLRTPNSHLQEELR